MSIAVWVPGTSPIQNQPPSVPAGLAASSITENSLVLSWLAATDDQAVAGYEYRIDSGVAIDVDTLLSVSVLLLSPATAYQFQVRAYDANGAFSAWSSAITATTEASQNQPPSVPAGLAASAITDTTLTLTWSASTDDVSVAGYEYRIGTGSPVDAGNALTANVTGLSAATAYQFQVRAYDGAGAFSAWSDAVSATTTGAAAPTYQVLYIESVTAVDEMRLSDTADKGLSDFAATVNALTDAQGNTFQITAIEEATLMANVAGSLAGVDVLITGSAVGDYTGAPASALDSWVRAGGSLISYSDNGIGPGDNNWGQLSRNSMGLPGWGFQQALDQKDYVQTRTLPSGHWLAANMTTRQIQGEGMSPVVVDGNTANHAAQGNPQVILARPNQTLSRPDGVTFTGQVAELAYSRPGQGLVFCLMDRQGFLNGPNTGSDITQVENRQFLRNILLASVGAITVPFVDFDAEWAAATATMDVVFDANPADFAEGNLTVDQWKTQFPSQMNDWKKHLEGTRGPLLRRVTTQSRAMLELYRPKVLPGENQDVWMRKILGQSHPNPLFPQLGLSGDVIRHEFSLYLPLHALQGGGSRGHICPKTVKLIGGAQGVTGVGNTGQNPQPAGKYEFVPTIYNHLPFYSNPRAKGDWRNTQWDTTGQYGPAVNQTAASYQTLTHFGIASYLYDPRGGQLPGHKFQEMFYLLYWDETTQQLTNIRRPLKPDTMYDIRYEVQANTRTELSPGVFNNGNNDGILRIWVRENNGQWQLGREELDLNIRGNGIDPAYHPTNPVPFGSGGFIDFTGGDGASYNLIASSGLVTEPTDSWYQLGHILLHIGNRAA